jgi:hypothetical protein
MKKLISIAVVAILFGAGLAGCAQDSMKKEGLSMKEGMPMACDMPMAKGMGMGMGMHMKMMDTNGDGMISKEEFMKHHEIMYDKMKKNSNGSVSLNDMHMMMDGMMKK